VDEGSGEGDEKESDGREGVGEGCKKGEKRDEGREREEEGGKERRGMCV